MGRQGQCSLSITGNSEQGSEAATRPRSLGLAPHLLCAPVCVCVCLCACLDVKVCVCMNMQMTEKAMPPLHKTTNESSELHTIQNTNKTVCYHRGCNCSPHKIANGDVSSTSSMQPFYRAANLGIFGY